MRRRDGGERLLVWVLFLVGKEGEGKTTKLRGLYSGKGCECYFNSF